MSIERLALGSSAIRASETGGSANHHPLIEARSPRTPNSVSTTDDFDTRLRLSRHTTLHSLTRNTLPHNRSHVLYDKAGDRHGAARYVQFEPHHHRRDQETDNSTARPTAALQPFRIANAAFISSSSTKPAAPVTQKPGLVSGAPGTPPPMKAITGKPHQEVPLPSQEGKQGVMQYALYVLDSEEQDGRRIQGLTWV